MLVRRLLVLAGILVGACVPFAASNIDRDGDGDGGADAAADSAVDADALIDAACRNKLGEYATWSGKVNLHRNAGATPWEVDPDCTSSTNVDASAYCQKFWPTTTAQARVDASAEAKDFALVKPGGDAEAPSCGGYARNPGQYEVSCCAP